MKFLFRSFACNSTDIFKFREVSFVKLFCDGMWEKESIIVQCLQEKSQPLSPLLQLETRQAWSFHTGMMDLRLEILLLLLNTNNAFYLFWCICEYDRP